MKIYLLLAPLALFMGCMNGCRTKGPQPESQAPALDPGAFRTDPPEFRYGDGISFQSGVRQLTAQLGEPDSTSTIVDESGCYAKQGTKITFQHFGPYKVYVVDEVASFVKAFMDSTQGNPGKVKYHGMWLGYRTTVQEVLMAYPQAGSSRYMYEEDGEAYIMLSLQLTGKRSDALLLTFRNNRLWEAQHYFECP